MAKKKQEDPPKGSPAWMATFSDLMNLLLCFFVLLFSMSTVDAEKFEMVIASFQESFSVLPSGGTSIGEGKLISSGVSMLEQFDVYLQASSGGETTNQEQKSTEGQDKAESGQQSEAEQKSQTAEEVAEAFEEQSLSESEKMAEQIEQAAAKQGIQDMVEVEFNAQYVLLTLNGALLFDSGYAEVREDALPLLSKISSILTTYDHNIIDIEGHTDNVPLKSAKFENNNVLSMYRALYVADYVRANTDIDPSHIMSSGRGEYVPIADNSTPEGRARNRRVEIKIYNSYNSEGIE